MLLLPVSKWLKTTLWHQRVLTLTLTFCLVQSKDIVYSNINVSFTGEEGQEAFIKDSFENWIKGYSIQTLRNHLIRFVIANESKQLSSDRKGILSSALNMKMNTSLVWHAKTSSSIHDAISNISINNSLIFQMNLNAASVSIKKIFSVTWLCLTQFFLQRMAGGGKRRAICWKAIVDKTQLRCT